MELLDKLEELKQMGSYQIVVYYGEGVGCDDSSVPKVDRSLVVIAHPVGVLGEVKLMFKGTVSSFLEFNLKSTPKAISNPPKLEDYEGGGYFIWGVERSVQSVLGRFTTND